MEINSVSNTGVFSGLYQTAVSASDMPIRPPPLQGVQHRIGGGPEATFWATLTELLQGRPPKTQETSPSLLWVSVLPLIRRGLQCMAGY
ncbi:avidin-like [Crotalus adamanteus]|uniref:Avidin-like n=1 Tax=Crotalus adamanteus TaxID=8729 RepID=A0AAW1C3E1_CROAD